MKGIKKERREGKRVERKRRNNKKRTEQISYDVKDQKVSEVECFIRTVVNKSEPAVGQSVNRKDTNELNKFFRVYWVIYSLLDHSLFSVNGYRYQNTS